MPSTTIYCPVCNKRTDAKLLSDAYIVIYSRQLGSRFFGGDWLTRSADALLTGPLSQYLRAMHITLFGFLAYVEFDGCENAVCHMHEGRSPGGLCYVVCAWHNDCGTF